MVPAYELKLWILGGLLGVLVPVLAFLLAREFKRKDQIGAEVKTLAETVTKSINELNHAVSVLTLAVEEIRTWSHERFVTRLEHTESIGSIRREIDKCQERCPSKPTEIKE